MPNGRIYCIIVDHTRKPIAIHLLFGKEQWVILGQQSTMGSPFGHKLRVTKGKIPFCLSTKRPYHWWVASQGPLSMAVQW